MPTILLRIFLLYNLHSSILLSLIPKKLRFLLPPSWYPHPHHHHHQANPTTTTFTISESLKSNPKTSSKGCETLISDGFQHTAPLPPSTLSGLKRMDPTELKRVFQMFDRNGDGRITKKELNDSLENLGIFIPDGDLTQMIDNIDVNRDGCVDIDEFGLLYQSIMDEKDEEEDMKEAFNVFDQNGDGYITVDELRSVLASLGLKQGRTVEDCKRMIMKVDVDGDGMVNYSEFRQMMKTGGFSALS